VQHPSCRRTPGIKQAAMRLRDHIPSSWPVALSHGNPGNSLASRTTQATSLPIHLLKLSHLNGLKMQSANAQYTFNEKEIYKQGPWTLQGQPLTALRCSCSVATAGQNRYTAAETKNRPMCSTPLTTLHVSVLTVLKLKERLEVAWKWAVGSPVHGQ
jgi:hypothetical protein